MTETHPRIDPAAWTTEDAEHLYGVDAWGQGVFGVTAEGHLAALPAGKDVPGIDLFDLAESLHERGLQAPVLIRLCDVLSARLRRIRSEFDDAIRKRGYRGKYRCLYPIKVNQERHLCEEIRDLAEELDFGFEAGSKPELLAVLGLTAGHSQIPIMCNGFKDAQYLETVTLAAKLGRDILPIVESPHELDLILDLARRHGVRPRLGLRMKLHSMASGHWETSGGAGSKFGLHATEVLWAVERLREADLMDCLQLLHCHVGSQVSQLASLRAPLEELGRTYVELINRGVGVRSVDVGGGLGVDYDGSHSGRGSSIDYGVREYAEAVVHTLSEICDAAGVKHPDVFSESGRAMVAGSSVLIVNVLARRRFHLAPREIPESERVPITPPALLELERTSRELHSQTTSEARKGARESLDSIITGYRQGHLGLAERSRAEELFAMITRELAARAGEDDEDELRSAAAAWGDLYIGNFSVFQSLPDSWALDQVFPVCPLHRLNERPTRSSVLADITCDSDGVIDHFSLHGEEWRTLMLHEPLEPHEEKPYYLGVFLVGAYQEILGDLHNLFGDAHAVHVRLDEEGKCVFEEVVVGETVREVLGYVHYDPVLLLERIRREVEAGIRAGTLSVAEGRGLLSNIVLGLDGYTYLE